MYPLTAPIKVDIKTAGIAIRIEFQKYGLIPSHLIPVHVDDQAEYQASKLMSLGKDIKLPVLISSSDFKDVVTMTKRGSVKYKMNNPSIVNNKTLKKKFLPKRFLLFKF